METLIVQPKNKKQLSAIKAFLKALDISFKEKEGEESAYNSEFVAMVKKAEKRGNYKTVDAIDIWGSLDLK